MGDTSTTWHCPQCGRKFRILAGKPTPDLCPDCARQFTLKRPVSDEDTSPKAAHADAQNSTVRVILTTAPTVAGYRIVETLEIVTAECVQGSTSWQKLTSSLTDFFGGRSGSMQKLLRSLRTNCLSELRKEAAEAGGNAVVCVSLGYSEIGAGRGESMLMLVASGTAVIVEPDEDPV